MKLPFWPEPSGYRDIELGLSRVIDLLQRLDNPHLKLPPTIHIAGTNGKGSTLSFLKSIFKSSGLKVHSYISPHLVTFNERIELANEEINDDFLNQILTECKKAAEIPPKIKATFFEGITVAAFLAFSKIKADILILETGMGGRLDATNVVPNPIVTIITPISFDHTEFLGNSLSKIAFEKGGIIKFESPTIISKQKPSALKTLKEIALAQKSNTLIYGQDFDQKKLPALGLKGEHQKMNASCAIAAINVLNHSGLFQISEKNIKDGLKNAVWKARLQEINQGQFFKILPKNFKLILDGGHNKAGARTISSWLLQENKKLPSKNYLICAMLKDKDSKGFLKIIAAQTEMMVGLKIKDEEKSKTSLEICQIASEINFKNISANDFSDAIEKIKEYHLEKHPKQPAKIIICGSLYLAGQFLSENNTKSYL